MRKWIALLLSVILCIPATDVYGRPSIMPGTDVLLDVGHGGIDSGTMHGKLMEKDLNLAIAKKTKKALAQKGFTVVMNRSRDYALSDDNKHASGSRHQRDLSQRTLIANAIAPKMMLSLHVNWTGNPDRRGPLMFYQNKSESILLAYLLQQSLNEIYGTQEKPVFGKPYYVLRKTNCPTVIVEVGFMSNAKDRKLLKDSRHQTQIAEAISSAVAQYFTMVHPVPSEPLPFLIP